LWRYWSQRRAIKAGEMFVNESLSYDPSWDRIPIEAKDPVAIAAYAGVSDIKLWCVHADTHGQSAAILGLAYLLGIELMLRIRRWR
jgi:hypothetical protein